VLGATVLTVCVGLLLTATAGAGGGAAKWTFVTPRAEEKGTNGTNVPAGSRKYGYLGPLADGNPYNKGVHRLTVRMPLFNAPKVAAVAIERQITTAKEGDHVELTFGGDPSDAVHGDEPPAKIAVFVHCVFEDEEGHERAPAWVKLGEMKVTPHTNSNQKLDKPISGAGCSKTVKLNENREIDGARIQLRGADDTDDHRRRAVYLVTFKLFDPGQGENAATVEDDFTRTE
jgi:hypothetical protein